MYIDIIVFLFVLVNVFFSYIFLYYIIMLYFIELNIMKEDNYIKKYYFCYSI